MQLTPQLLTEALRQTGHLPFGTVASLREMQRFAGFADAIVRLELTFIGAPQPVRVIAKAFGPTWYSVSGRPELVFYLDLAPFTPSAPVPALLGVYEDEAQSTALLLLEDLDEEYAPATLPAEPRLLEHLVDVLVALHAPWWGSPQLDAPALYVPERGVTRMPQALSAEGLRPQAETARRELDAFTARHAGKLNAGETSFLRALSSAWPGFFEKRVAGGRAITLLHGDLHLLGNVFVSKAGVAGGVRLIDWAQAKRGLGPHDLMYLLLAADVPDRAERDTRLLRRYHEGLLAAGVSGYTWAQCLWDYRFSVLTNVWQAVFQDSPQWLRKTLAVVQAWESVALLTRADAPRLA